MTTIQANVGTVSIHNDPNPGLATLEGIFHHIWRSEMMAYIFLGIIVALALYWLFKYGDPSKMDGGK